MTFKHLFILLSCFILKQGLVAQVVPPPATQTETDAGVNRFKYVTPYTFKNSSLLGGGGGGTNTPGGATPMVQMNMGGVLVGTTNMWYDVTNSVLSMIASGVLPAFRIGRTNDVAGYTNTLSGLTLQSIYVGADPGFGISVGNSAVNAFAIVIYTNRLQASISNNTDLGSVTFPFRDAYLASNVYASALNLSATIPGELTLRGTNSIPYIQRAAGSNAVSVTNIVGLIHRANAVYQALDCNFGNEFQITNRIAQNTVVDWQNLSAGQEVSLRFSAAVAGGTDYYITNIFPSTWLVADQSTNAAPIGTSLTVFAGNGKGVELNIKAYKLLSNTNVAGAIYNTYRE